MHREFSGRHRRGVASSVASASASWFRANAEDERFCERRETSGRRRMGPTDTEARERLGPTDVEDGSALTPTEERG
jgi:hypothetical protein